MKRLLYLLPLLALLIARPATAITAIVHTGDQNTPASFLEVDSATGDTGLTGLTGSAVGTKVALTAGVAGSLTITVQFTAASNGAVGAFANGAGSVAESGNGTYDYFASAGEVAAAGILKVHAVAAGAKTSDSSIQIIGVNFNDTSGLGLSRLDVVLSSRLASSAAPANWSSMLISSGGVVSGLVTGYSAGQDPGTLTLAATVDGSITLKQSLALCVAVIANNFTVVRNTSAKTLTVNYKRADRSTIFATMVTTYSDTALTQAVSRTVTFFNMP